MSKVKKAEVLADAKLGIDKLLEELEPIVLQGSELYIITAALYSKLLIVEETLIPLQSDTRRGQAYSIDKIVRILNPKNIAFKYSMTLVWKSTMVTDKGKCIDRLPREKEISKEKILKRAKDTINDEELSGFSAQKVNEDAQQIVNSERVEFDKAEANPEDYDIAISGFKERIQYGQISWYYYDENDKKTREQRHMAKNIPSILVFDDSLDKDNDEFRADMKIAKFIKEGYRAFGNVYLRLKNKEDIKV